MAGLSTARELSLPDLVILGVLADGAEGGLHGYEIDQTLARNGTRLWADLSRPQIYYSLKKLERRGLIGEVAEVARGAAGASDPDESDPPGGPDRVVYSITSEGRRQLRLALARDEWASRAAAPPFATWLALSPILPHADSLNVLRKREEFLQEEITRRETSRSDASHQAFADWGMDLIIAQLRTELEFVRRGLRIKSG